MSYELEKWAREQAIGNATAKYVLRELAYCHNRDTGLCCPAIKTLSETLELSKNPIKAAIKYLITTGFLEVKEVKAGNRTMRTEYTFPKFDGSNSDGSISDPIQINESDSDPSVLPINESNSDPLTADGSNSDPLDGSISDPSNSDGSISDSLMGQILTPNQEYITKNNKTTTSLSEQSFEVPTEPVPDYLLEVPLEEDDVAQAMAELDGLPPIDFEPELSDEGKAKRKPKNRYPDCPYEAIKDLYHQYCPELPRVQAFTTKRHSSIKARWEFVARENKTRDAKELLAFFEEFFKNVAESNFLCGRLPPSKGRSKPFKADLDWLMNPQNFIKCIEGRYTN